MPILPYPTALQGSSVLAAQGRVPWRFVAVQQAPMPLRSQRDLRHFRPTTGVITDRVMLRTGPSSEIPFALGRVWLLRLLDGYKAWEGWSDANGYYTATGLELDVDYIAVGIDPQRNHKATGAGPVRATLPEAS